MWGITPEVVLLVVVAVQVFVMLVQFWAVRQHTRVAVLDKRVKLYEAAKRCVAALESFYEYEARGVQEAPKFFDDRYFDFMGLLRSYRYLFDKPTQSLMDEIANGCWALRLEACDADVESWDQREPLGKERRLALERELSGPKLDELSKRVGRHLKVSRLLG